MLQVSCNVRRLKSWQKGDHSRATARIVLLEFLLTATRHSVKRSLAPGTVREKHHALSGARRACQRRA